MFMLDRRSLLRREYPVRVEISVPPAGFTERQYNALQVALLTVDHVHDRRHEDLDWVAYRFRTEGDAEMFRQNVGRAHLPA